MEQAGAEEAVESEFQGRARPCLILASILFLLTSCGTESVFVLGAGLANFVYTDKVPTDYIAEAASGKECNLLQAIEDGGPMCRDSFEQQVIEKPIYCYRTLGQPTCYATPDPYGTGAERIR
ncbi:MAG: hypothetical protein GKS00_21660 [Alphaproteobacteria bacterium]|nr:hypothetical protein [Alphaproteobacteria bacterium]